jgi:uncharacterized damage-inducible protein DinB
MTTALTAEELLAWVEATSKGWRDLATTHPEILAFPCDVYGTHTVGGLLHHITVVELRYAQRIHGLTESSYDEVSAESVASIYTAHDQAMHLYREAIANPATAWETPIEFKTRSAGVLLATPRTIFIHAVMHSIRHYAQLATLVRQHGIKPGWQMDYLFMGATRP